MKKILLACLFLLQIHAYCQSSVYKPFCNNPSWTVVSTSFGISNYNTYQYQIDTTIGIYTYKKIKEINSSLFALFREDPSQKKVYQYDKTNSVDYLYIDFNLNLGDPFNLKTFDGSVYTLTVCTKDSVLINGCYHNKINLSNSGGFTYYNFVEGILSEVNPINSYWWPGDPQTWTICECHNGQFYYNFDAAQINNFSCYLTCSPSVPCSSPTNVNELVTDIKFEVHPNPANDIINLIDKQNKFQNSTIEIKNPLGQTVYSNSFTNQINLSNLSNGMYFLTMQNKSATKTIKIIKQ